METLSVTFDINGRWDGDRNGTGFMKYNGIEIPVSVPAGLNGPGVGSNPEGLLISSAATCYIITLAAMLNKREISYTHLEINSEGLIQKDGGSLKFKSIVHKPVIFLHEKDRELKEKVEQLADRAEKACFIGSTLKPNIEISVQPDVRFV